MIRLRRICLYHVRQENALTTYDDFRLLHRLLEQAVASRASKAQCQPEFLSGITDSYRPSLISMSITTS